MCRCWRECRGNVDSSRATTPAHGSARQRPPRHLHGLRLIRTRSRYRLCHNKICALR
ncbi:Uncharacterized protein ToN1_08660 [Aromatoleum petrolei]|nr:Uncharacterized protein ToN1_08660 [Aromatoleum petrolei]